MLQRAVLMVAAGGLAVSAFAPAARAQTTREVSRSAPIVATVVGVEAQYQGSFEVQVPAVPPPTFEGAASAATFVFPFTRGHLRAVDTASITGATVAFQDLPELFDAADGIPPVTTGGCLVHFTADCRTVFTTVEAPDAAGLAEAPDRVFVNTTNLTGLKPLLAPAMADAEVGILIERILAGVPDGLGGFLPGFGGIDRSTLAVIEHSPFTPPIAGGDRPTMIYVGGLDGMLHAICAEVLGACDRLGRELWAFIPRTQLGALRLNTQRIDGSVKVADVFDDFTPLDGITLREFRTILTFQTGSGDPAAANLQPSVIAIDVSNPGDPIVLWERSTPASPGVIDLGVGLTLAMGPARVAAAARNLVFAQTNNGGTGPSGFYVAGYDTVTGERVWFFRAVYPAPRNGANPVVPDSGIPGGVVAFDRDQSGQVTHIAFSTLYGDLWVMEADGDRPYGSVPIFRFSTDFHPIGGAPTLYSDLATSQLFAVVVSGGYVDPVAATWVRPTDDQFVVSVSLDPQEPPPIDEVGASGDIPFVVNLGPGGRTTAQAIIAGNELFVTTDSTDANLLAYGEVPDTGSLGRFSLTTGLQVGSSVTVSGGASSAAVTAAGMVHVGGGAGTMKVAATATGGGAFDAVGAGVERSPVNNNQRLLWMNE